LPHSRPAASLSGAAFFYIDIVPTNQKKRIAEIAVIMTKRIVPGNKIASKIKMSKTTIKKPM